jgi:hypothetical protein
MPGDDAMDHVEPLLEEYKQLFAWANSNALTSLKVPPLVLGAIIGIGVTSKELHPLFGIGIAFSIFVMFVWLGYCDSMVNGIGLRLIDIEQRINQAAKLSEHTSLTWHKLYIAESGRVLPGFSGNSLLVGVVLLLVLVGALWQSWLAMTWAVPIKIAVVAFLSALNVAGLGNLLLGEQRTLFEKRRILALYQKSDV